jgi:four helix bundle protein
MSKTEKFEDIQAWQRARKITDNIYQVTRTNKFNKDFPLRDQIRRASISIMSNISEGFSRETDKEFIRFLTISKASASEVQSQLYIALDQNYIEKKVFEELYEMLDHCSRQIANLIFYLKGTRKTDPKDA